MRAKASLKILKGSDPKSRLVESLRNLKTAHGASALKLSTEDAAMSLEQIRFWVRLSEGIVPAVVKIGGPNARNDIRQLVASGVDGLIAPMVESAYGLENFIAAVRDFTTPMQFGRLMKHINIETETAVKQLDSILACPDIKWIDEITIGCSDLSQSLKKDRTDPAVARLVKKTVRKIRAKNIGVSLGGGITPERIDDFLKDVKPDKFNTRIVTFDIDSPGSYRTAVEEALRFELLMLEHDSKMQFISRDEEKFRAAELKKRLG